MDKQVDAYIEKQKSPQKEILQKVRKIFQETLLNCEEKSAIGKCEVTVQMTADRDYELFTELGYESADGPRWNIIPLHFTKQGEKTKISFDCELRPVMVQLDPFCRIPHINIENCVWRLPRSG